MSVPHGSGGRNSVGTAAGWVWRLACASVLLHPGAATAQQQPERMQVNADHVMLRVAQSIDSSIVRALAKGTVVTVLGRDGAWVKVQAPSANGWVRASQLVRVTTDGSGKQPAPAPLTETAPLPIPTRVAAAVPSGMPRPAERSVALTLFGGVTQSTGAFASGSQTTFGSHRGFGGGAGVIIHPRGVGFELDATFVQKGLTATTGGATQTVRTGYVEVPLLLRVAIGGRSSALVLMAGGETAYEVSCGENLAASGTSAAIPCSDDSNFDHHVRLDYGVIGSVGVEIGSFVLAGRYDVGLRDLYNSEGVHGRNRSLLIFGGATF